MARTTHDRLNDHFGEDAATNVVLNGPTTSYDDGQDLHSVIADLDSRVTSSETIGTINFIVDGTTGIKGDVELGFTGSWLAARILADQAGDIVIDVWKDSYANYPPTDADSITASAEPTITGDDQSEDTTLSGWLTSFEAGDILRINVDSVATITRATLSLTFRRSVGYTRSPGDSLAITDAIDWLAVLGRTESDTVTLSDAAVAVVT